MPLHHVAPDEPILDLAPSQLTRNDWVRICGEECVEWMELTSEQRWVESLKLWRVFLALGGRIDDDAPPPPDFRLRRLGV